MPRAGKPALHYLDVHAVESCAQVRLQSSQMNSQLSACHSCSTRTLTALKAPDAPSALKVMKNALRLPKLSDSDRGT